MTLKLYFKESHDRRTLICLCYDRLMSVLEESITLLNYLIIAMNKTTTKKTYKHLVDIGMAKKISSASFVNFETVALDIGP